MTYNRESTLMGQKTNFKNVIWAGAKIDGIINSTKVKLPNSTGMNVVDDSIFKKFIKNIKKIFSRKA